MNKEMVVLQGKTFTIELQSMLGSTVYGWCLSELPKGIILESTDCVPTGYGAAVAPVLQRFCFGVASAEETQAEIAFVMTNITDPSDTKSEYRVAITIIPSNSEDFVAYSDNATELYGFICDASKAQMPYGMVCAQNVGLKYGYPCGVRDAIVKYGYPYGAQDAAMKYGYMPVEMYGVPCSMSNTVLKYGYPGCC